MGTEDYSNIKYVAVEVIKKDATKSLAIENGLYMGIIRKTNDVKITYDFLVLMLNNTTVRLYNLRDYNIVTLEIVHEATKSMTVFHRSKEDQLDAKIDLIDLSEVLIKEKMHYISDPNKELIDPNNYSNYKKDSLMAGENLINLKKVKTQSEKADDIIKSNVVNKTDTNKNISFNRKIIKNTDSINGIMKLSRKGKLPKIKNLTTMKEKVRLVSSGEYKVKFIQQLLCDMKDEEKDTYEYEDSECGYNMYGHGMGRIG